jgi:hypothetical protein
MFMITGRAVRNFTGHGFAGFPIDGAQMSDKGERNESCAKK